MKEKSIKVNAILNAIRIFMNLIFPLITYPYVTRILGATNLGKVQFGSSIIAYFSLIAMLGINSYAVREGSPIRDDKEKISKFANEIFSINILFTMISYILLAILICLPTKIALYTKIILIQSISIIFTTIGVDWIYTIYEDFKYITIKSIVTQIISMCLLFLFVRQEDDYLIYALITVISTAGVNIFNFIHVKKYCKLKLTKDIKLTTHIKSLVVLFSNELAIKVYINSDTIILGFLTTDYNVGIYSIAVKIYNIVKSLINAIITVTLPRLALYNQEDNKEKFLKLSEKILNVCIILIIPTIVGLSLLSEEIILILSGKEYIEATSSLQILSIALGFAVLGNFFANAILVQNKKEKYVLRITMSAAIVNVALNFVLIPILKQNGAAITTAIAEFIVMFISFLYGKKYIKVHNIGKNIATACIGCIFIYLTYTVIKKLFTSTILILIVTVGMGVIVYFMVAIILRNQVVIELVSEFTNFGKNKLKKCK